MLKILTLAVLTFALTAPGLAAEMTKGGKSYQKRSNINQPSATQTPQSPEDVADIAPAAGGNQPSDEQSSASANTEGKSLREELRLPRKN